MPNNQRGLESPGWVGGEKATVQPKAGARAHDRGAFRPSL